jgi:hypothetical protein
MKADAATAPIPGMGDEVWGKRGLVLDLTLGKLPLIELIWPETLSLD